MNSIVTRVRVADPKIHENNSFMGYFISIDSEGAGTYLTITGEDRLNDGAKLSFDWEHWDEIVKVVSTYRKEWEGLE